MVPVCAEHNDIEMMAEEEQQQPDSQVSPQREVSSSPPLKSTSHVPSGTERSHSKALAFAFPVLRDSCWDISAQNDL